MNKDDFYETFRKLAFIHYKSMEKTKEASQAYFDEVKHFTVKTLYDVMQDISHVYDGKNWPYPAELKNMCNTKLLKIQSNPETEEAYRARCRTPEALKAKREFYEKVARLSDESLDNRSKWCAGLDSISTIELGLGQAIILQPYEIAKKIKERESSGNRN